MGDRERVGRGEMELLDGGEVRSREPEVACRGAFLSRADASVDFGALTRGVWRRAVARGVRFLPKSELASVSSGGGTVRAVFRSGGSMFSARCRLLINAAGGGALRIARAMGFARELAVLHFRGEYWVVDEPFASRVTSNIYSPPELPSYRSSTLTSP
ncbi:MAG: FAD-dependent oxidoreductase [Nitrososphaerota archaeon]|nr:FAD-dependent oxidoreductase [Nitrososphaerota archaeon]